MDDFILPQMTLEDAKQILKMEAGWDWEKFRREAAKDILCAIISTTVGANPKDVTMAIEIADELIKQLREEKK